MTREEARKKAEIMLAYADGKEIEFYNDEYKIWAPINDPSFDDCVDYYRIKREQKYRPFKDAEECLNEMKKHEPCGWLYNKSTHELNNSLRQITYISDKAFRLTFDSLDRKFDSAFGVDPVYFADGTPFGIKEEE